MYYPYDFVAPISLVVTPQIFFYYNEFVIDLLTIFLFLFSVAPDKNKKITSLMKKADKATTFKKTCGYLSDAELVEYLTMFPNPEKLFKEVPVVRKRRELWNTG